MRNSLETVNKKRIRKSDFFGYIFWIILCIESAITFTDLQPQGISARILLLIEIGLFCIILFFEKYTVKSLLIIVLMIICGLVTYYNNGFTQLLTAIMAAISFQSIKSKNNYKFLFYVRLIVMLFVNILSLTGIVNFGMRVVGKSYGNIVGYGLGYSHPNRYAYSFIFLILAYTCWKNENIKKRDYLRILILGLIGYSITKSRTLLIISVFLVLLVSVYKSNCTNKYTKHIIKWVGILIFPLSAIFSLTIPLIISGSGSLAVIFGQINQMTSYRLSIITRVFEYYTPTLFGGVNDFSLLLQTYNYNTIDNGYIRVLFGFGIIGLVIFLAFTVLSIGKLLKKSEYIYVICAIVVAFWGLSENILLYNSFNISILFWGVLFNRLTKKPKSMSVYQK